MEIAVCTNTASCPCRATLSTMREAPSASTRSRSPHMLSTLIGLLWIGPRWAWRVLPILLALPAIVPAQSTIVLGNATAELTGPWRFHTGDNPAWAQPDFDDSGWSTMDLTLPRGSYDPYV